MTSTATRPATASTRREDILTTLFGLWLVIGLLVDAYNHVTNPDLESFWTPWHALFYSGFTATAIWIGRVALKRRQSTGGIVDWAPPGYRLSIIGVAIFGVGGVGDAIWHTVFGVESSLDALLSPTHLMLWIGGLLMLSTGLRVAWMTDAPKAARSYRDFLPVTLSLALTVNVVAFFFIYAWNLNDPGVIRSVYAPNGVIVDSAEGAAAFGVLGVLVQTVILIIPALLVRRRWTVPVGTMTTVFSVVAFGMAFGFDGEPLGVPATIAAGVVFDLTANRGIHLAPIATPVVLFGAYFLTVGLTGNGIGWPPEIWSGAIVLAVLTCVAFERIVDAAGALHETS